MERVTKRYQDLDKALIQFSNSIELLTESKKHKPKNSPETIAFRDSVIKRFEICFDLLWKSLKDFLAKKHGQEVVSPKKVFQECFNQKLLSENELREALEMSDDRNETVHTYSDEMAERIAQKAETHFNLMKKLYRLIKI